MLNALLAIENAVRFEFSGQDATSLRSKRIDARPLSHAERMQIDAATRDATFFSAKVSDAKLLEKMQNYIAEAAEGKRFRNRNDFISTFKRELGAGKEDWKTHGKLTDITSSRRLGLIFDFQRERLSAERFLAQGDDADHAWAFPALELIRKESRKVPRDWLDRWREAGGVVRHGRMVALRDDPIWRNISRFGSPVPPFDFNSGMGLEEVNRFDAEALGLELPQEEEEETAAPEEVLNTLEARARKVVDSVPENQKESYRVMLDSTSPLCKEAAVKAAEKKAIPILKSLKPNDSNFSPEKMSITISYDAEDITRTHEFFHYVDYVAGNGSFATASKEFESARRAASRAIAKAKKSRAEAFAELRRRITVKTPKAFREEADAKLRALGADPQKVYRFFDEVKASESALAKRYFWEAGIESGDANNVRVWWFARCIERQDPEGAALCFASKEEVFRERIKRGAMRSLSDYIGTITRNKSLGYGGALCFGHRDRYYRLLGIDSNSELMAQFGAMYGDYEDTEISRLIARAAAPDVWERLTDILKDFTKGKV